MINKGKLVLYLLDKLNMIRGVKEVHGFEGGYNFADAHIYSLIRDLLKGKYDETDNEVTEQDEE